MERAGIDGIRQTGSLRRLYEEGKEHAGYALVGFIEYRKI